MRVIDNKSFKGYFKEWNRCENMLFNNCKLEHFGLIYSENTIFNKSWLNVDNIRAGGELIIRDSEVSSINGLLTATISSIKMIKCSARYCTLEIVADKEKEVANNILIDKSHLNIAVIYLPSSMTLKPTVTISNNEIRESLQISNLREDFLNKVHIENNSLGYNGEISFNTIKFGKSSRKFLQEVKEKNSFEKLRIYRCSFDTIDFSDFDFGKAIINDCIFYKCNMGGCDMSRVEFYKSTVLDSCDLTGFIVNDKINNVEKTSDETTNIYPKSVSL